MNTVEQTKRLNNFDPQENEKMAAIILSLKHLQEQGKGDLISYLRSINADENVLAKLEGHVNEEIN